MKKIYLLIQRLSLLLVTCISITGCGIEQLSIYPIQQQKDPEITIEKNYRIGEPIESFIGSPMISVQAYVTQIGEFATPTQAVRYSHPITDAGGGTAQAGLKHRILGTTMLDDEMFYVVELNSSAGGRTAALVRPDGTLYEQVFDLSGIVGFMSKLETPNARFHFETVKQYVETLGGSNNYELIFSGISGEYIRLLYREYTGGGLARSAFSQELSYDRTAKTIRFRKVLMNLIKVDNERIVISVVSD